MTRVPGQRFHDFVATLERMFALREDMKIDSPLRLPDKDTGRLREHDIVITRCSHHGLFRTALECRDHARPVGVPQVEAFAKKCEKTGIHRGIIVSASGFTKTAHQKAAALNLGCMDLTQVERLDWFGTVNITAEVYNFTAINVHVRPVFCAQDMGRPLTIYDQKGAVFSAEQIQALLMDAVRPALGGVRHSRMIEGEIVLPMDGFHIREADGTLIPLIDAKFSYGLQIDVTEQPFTLHQYRGETGAQDLATGQIMFAGGQSTIAFVKSGERVMGYLFSSGGWDHRLKIGDLPERQLTPASMLHADRDWERAG